MKDKKLSDRYLFLPCTYRCLTRQATLHIVPPVKRIHGFRFEADKVFMMAAIYDDEILGFFIEESQELIHDLKGLGESLKKVGIPNEEESTKLSEFAQKLNRLIGGTASMGFEPFAPLSRKTSLLAARCAEIKEITVRLLMANMNAVVAVLDESFQNLASVKDIEKKISDIESRIDICMAAVDLAHPDIKSQDEIDNLLKTLNI